ncbi:MAG: nuclear transport factor 2 family protein [Actinomycetota bacterium]
MTDPADHHDPDPDHGVTRRRLLQRAGAAAFLATAAGALVACADDGPGESAGTSPTPGEGGATGAPGSSTPPGPVLPGSQGFDRERAARNLEVVNRGYETVAAGEFDAAAELLAEDATWTLFSANGEPSQVVEGREEIRRLFIESVKQECARAESLPFGDIVITTHAGEDGRNCAAVAWILRDGVVGDVISLDVLR